MAGQPWRRRIVIRATVVFVWPAPSWAALLTRPLSRRTWLSRRRPARETRTLTLPCLPGAIEKRVRPSVTRLELARRRAVSLVRPEQRPTVATGQLSLSVMNLPPKVSLVETSLTPAKAGVAGVVGLVAVWDVEDDAGAGEVWVGGGGVGAGGGGEAVVKVWSAPCLTTAELAATSR